MGPWLPHSGALPGQEGLEGDAHWEVGTAGTYSLQDACLAQLLCHMSHIEEARKLWPWDRATGTGVKELKAVGKAGQSARRGQGQGSGRLWGRELGELTFPGLGLRQWMK